MGKGHGLCHDSYSTRYKESENAAEQPIRGKEKEMGLAVLALNNRLLNTMVKSFLWPLLAGAHNLLNLAVDWDRLATNAARPDRRRSQSQTTLAESLYKIAT